ncbi:hypothetical protein F4819DRAFT_259391 [Hypoxylon fuscum]|nr:hypothetical protein F4819DRAFT_259391 [Hypoxylon fuscum]
MAANQGAFHLNGTNRTQAPVPATGPSGRPLGPPAAPVHPIPALPRSAPPANLARGPSVEVSDVSRDLITADDMREELSEYAVCRIEKMPVQGRYDDEGRPQLPTWDQAIRNWLPDTSPKETARTIQHLNRTTRTLADKRKSLSPVLQRQIDAAQGRLAELNPDPLKYHWELAQIDHQLREINPYVVMAGGNHSSSRRHHGSTRRRHRLRTNERNGRSYERISLTAYYKRTPRPNVDIPTLYEAKKRMLSPQNGYAVRPNNSPDPRTLAPGAGPLGVGAPVGPNGGRGGLPPAAPRPNNLRPEVRGNPINNVAVGGREDGREATRNHNHIESYLDSSDYSSSDGSCNSQMTPATSQSSGSFSNGGNHRLDHRNDQVPAHNTTRRPDDNGPRQPPTAGSHPPPLRTSNIDIERIRDDAYLAGIRDGRGRGRGDARRSRPMPRIIQDTRPLSPSYRRHTGHSGPEGRMRHREDLDSSIDRLRRLSLDDEDGYDAAILRRADARRRREFEYLLQRGSVLDDDPFDRDRVSYTREGGRRYREAYVTDGSESDFSPTPRSRRRSRY